jgi:hypothetical protein
MLRRVALVRTDVSEPSASETSVLTRATRRNIPEDPILQSHRRENLKSNRVFCVQFLTTLLFVKAALLLENVHNFLHYKFYNVTFVLKLIFVFILTLEAIKKF